MRKSPAGCAFDQGYVCAVANIIRTHREDVIAKDVLAAAGVIDWTLIAAEDLKVLREAGLAPRKRRIETGEDE